MMRTLDMLAAARAAGSGATGDFGPLMGEIDCLCELIWYYGFRPPDLASASTVSSRLTSRDLYGHPAAG